MKLFHFLGFALLFSLSAFAQSVEPIHALLLTGGCCHDYGAQQKILTEGISARANVVWTILYEGGSSKGGVIRNHHMSIYDKPDWSKGYDVVVHNECFGDVTNADFVNHIAAGHNGVPAVVIHCTIHTYRKAPTDEWRKVLGVSSYAHEPARLFDVVNLATNNPIMKDFPAVWHDPAPDELYQIKKVWPTCTPLAKGIGKTGAEHPCIWINTYNKTRVFGTTLGHSDATMSSDTYLDLLTRGLLWACNKLDENGQPKPGYGPVAAAVK